MTDSFRHKMLRPATKGELGFVAADAVLGFRSIQLALLALKAGDKDAMSEQIEDLERHADSLWKRFEELTSDE